VEPIEKLEIIIKHEIRKVKAERERGIDKHSPLYIQDLSTRIDTLSWVWTKANAIMGDAPSVTDEMIQRLYGTEDE
jgi:hypothetical protein